MQGVAAVYVDGGVIDRNPSDIGGTWAYVMVDKSGAEVARAAGVVISPLATTNNQTEFHAAIEAMRDLPTGWEGTIYSDSQNTIGRLSMGWKMTNIWPFDIDEFRYQVLRMGEIRYRYIRGHVAKKNINTTPDASRWNTVCDSLCHLAGDTYKSTGVRAFDFRFAAFQFSVGRLQASVLQPV